MDPIVVEQNAVLWVDVHVHPGAVLNAEWLGPIKCGACTFMEVDTRCT